MSKNKIIMIIAVAILVLLATGYFINSRNTSINEIMEDDSVDGLDINVEPLESFTLTDVWDDSATEDVTIEIKLSQDDNNMELDIPIENDYNRGDIELVCGEETIRLLFSGEKRPKAIKGIRACDIDYDGHLELIMLIDTGYEEQWLLYNIYGMDAYEPAYDITYMSKYFKDFPQNMSVEETLECLENAITGGNKNGQFKSCKDAYIAVIKAYEYYSLTTEAPSYNLVYIDDDKIPELLIEAGDYIIAYSYKDGSLILAVEDGSDFPLFQARFYDSYYYSYVPKKSIVCAYYCDDDDAGYRGNLYYKFTKKGLKKLYYCSETVDTDSRNYTDEDLSISQILKKGEELSRLDYQDLEAEKDAKEILKEIEQLPEQ